MRRFFFLCLCFFLISIPINRLLADEVSKKTGIFSTWEVFEVDKCASIWLIKRFINKDAEIKFFPKGSMITEGIPFDTPEGRLRRYHNMSTFESFLKYYNLQDPKLVSIGKIMHDIEVNIWERKAFSESRDIEERIQLIIKESKTSAQIIERSVDYFDRLYEMISPDI